MPVFLALLACLGTVLAPSFISACPGSPCFVMDDLVGRWDLTGFVAQGVFAPSPLLDINVRFTTEPALVHGYRGDTLMGESPVSLACTSLVSDPGIGSEYGPFHAVGGCGAACVQIYYGVWDPQYFGFDCETPCLLIENQDSCPDAVYYVYEWHAPPVSARRSAWSTLKALFAD